MWMLLTLAFSMAEEEKKKIRLHVLTFRIEEEREKKEERNK